MNINNITIRPLSSDENHILEDFLYLAIFVPDGAEAPPRQIIECPELQVYIKDFGSKKDDYCFVAETDNKVVGAVWVRDMPDYGHIGDGVPSFAISVRKSYRGQGIGTHLMNAMLDRLKVLGYPKASLSVQKENYATQMYLKLGFRILSETDEEYIMTYVF